MVESIEELRKTCQVKDNLPERKVSIYITKLMLMTPITANQVTLLSLIVGVVSSFFLALGGKWYSIVGASLLQLFPILDCVDGEVARYRKSSSALGLYWERIVHEIVHPLSLIALGIGGYRSLGDFSMLIAGFSGAFGMSLRSLSYAHLGLLAPNYKKGEPLVAAARQKFEKSKYISIIRLFALGLRKSVIINIFLVGAIIDGVFDGMINFKVIILILYGIILPVVAILSTQSSMQILRKMDTIKEN